MRRLYGRRAVDARQERGAVMVLVAVTLPVLALFVMFAIDVSHWFDYSRNLQNRADAAALAAGLEYGGTCLAADPSPTALANIGQTAQDFAGAGSTSDLYFPYPGVANEKNIPNLKAGALDHFHFLINSQNFWQTGDTSATQSFTMGSPSTVCSSVDEDGKRGPFVDVKLSQDSLPLFLPLVGLRPTITAHARVSLEQGTQANNVRPLAVRDDSATPCVSVKLVYASGPLKDTTLQTINLSKDAAVDPSYPTAILWDNPGGNTVNLPSGVNLSDLYVQPFLNNCAGTGTTYDDTTNSGLNWINVYNTPTVNNGDAPAITTGGVFLSGCSSNGTADNQYFTSDDCSIGITANVAFAPNVTLGGDLAQVWAVDSSTGNRYRLQYQSGTQYHLDIPDQVTAGSGQHAFDIQAIQEAGSVPGKNGPTNCGPGPGNPKPCTTDLGVRQQAFGACNSCDQPDDSGPIVALRIHPATGMAQDSGANVFAATDTPKLVFEVDVQGLHFDAPGAKPTVLRFGITADKETGLINCGQGTGASADANAITNGCPLFGQPECAANSSDFCAPLTIYKASLHPNGICDPELRETANPALADCVQATSGQRRNKIPGAIASLIVQGGVCSPDHWPEYSADPTNYTFPPDDPRAITMIITSPADLSQQNVIVPIRNFATFYVTGWDTGNGNGAGNGGVPCSLPPPDDPLDFPPPYGNEPFPGTGPKNTQNGAIWGHWIFYTDPTIGGDGTFCTNTFGVCAPVLSR